MKSGKGFTLVSVIVYVICLTIAISTVMMLNSFFFADVMQMSGTGESVSQFNKFNMFFIEDMKEAINVDSSYITYDENAKENYYWVKIVRKDQNVIYKLQNNGIYRNEVKIVDNVSVFEARNINKDQESIGITVFLKLANENIQTYTMDYYIGRGY